MEHKHELSYEEFLAFILWYAAYADLEVESHERKEILNMSGHDASRRMKELVESMNDEQRIELILEHRKLYLGSEEKILKLLQDIHRIFMADEHFTAVEKYYESHLKRLLHI